MQPATPYSAIGAQQTARAYLHIFRPVAPLLCAVAFVGGWMLTGNEALLHVAGGLGVSCLMAIGYALAARRLRLQSVLAASVVLDTLLIDWLIWQLPNPGELTVAYLWSLVVAALLVSPAMTFVAAVQIIVLLIGMPFVYDRPGDAATLITQSIIFMVLAGALAFVRSEQSRIAGAFERSRRQLNDAQRVANIGSWEWQPDTDEVQWSEEMYRMLEVEPGTRIDFAKFTDLLSPEERPRVLEAIERTVANDEPYDIDIALRRSDGQQRIVRAQGEMRIDDHGRRWLVGTAQDVTALRHVEQLQNEFVASASHELRTPATIVYGFAETLDTHWQNLSEENRRDFVRQILAAARRLTQLVEDVLHVSRIEASQVHPVPQPFDVSALVARAVHEIQDDRVSSSTPEKVTVHADPQRVRQVVDNLVANAARHARERIEVAVTPGDRVATISVADDGPGVPEGERERVFERFVRLDAARHSEGTGLGLYIARQLVELSGGEISVGESPLGGARFAFTLPLAAAHTDSAAEAPDNSRQPTVGA